MPDPIGLSCGEEFGVAYVLTGVEVRLFCTFGAMIGVKIECLLPDLRRARYCAKRGFNLWGQHRPDAQEDRDAEERHDELSPELAHLNARVIAGSDLQQRDQPAQADDAEIG